MRLAVKLQRQKAPLSAAVMPEGCYEGYLEDYQLSR